MSFKIATSRYGRTRKVINYKNDMNVIPLDDEFCNKSNKRSMAKRLRKPLCNISKLVQNKHSKRPRNAAAKHANFSTTNKSVETEILELNDAEKPSNCETSKEQETRHFYEHPMCQIGLSISYVVDEPFIDLSNYREAELNEEIQVENPLKFNTTEWEDFEVTNL